MLGAFVFWRSSKTWFNNVSRVWYMNRYLRTRIRTTIWRSTKNVKVGAEPKLCAGDLRRDIRKGTYLKGKRLFRPWWITIESLANVKGMSVILHGLHPVPINRWTAPPYCSCWLGILVFASHLYPYILSSRRYICNLITFLFFHSNKIEMSWYIILHVIF
jgi:hypothetical protein